MHLHWPIYPFNKIWSFIFILKIGYQLGPLGLQELRLDFTPALQLLERNLERIRREIWRESGEKYGEQSWEKSWEKLGRNLESKRERGNQSWDWGVAVEGSHGWREIVLPTCFTIKPPIAASQLGWWWWDFGEVIIKRSKKFVYAWLCWKLGRSQLFWLDVEEKTG